jgi:ketosteroid isomerase-like protein
VPILVLLGSKRGPAPPANSFPGDFERYFRAGIKQRIDHFGRFVQGVTQGTLVLTSKSGHFIQTSEPDLVVWAIRRALGSATPPTQPQRPIGASVSAALPTRSRAVDSILALDSAWARAYVTHDTVFARALFADDFVDTRSGGQVTGREAELADVRPIAGIHVEYFRTEDVRCRVYESTAVVTGLAVWSVNANGQSSTLRRRYTAVYVRGGPLGWRMAALQLGSAPG